MVSKSNSQRMRFRNRRINLLQIETRKCVYDSFRVILETAVSKLTLSLISEDRSLVDNFAETLNQYILAATMSLYIH
jgi:hypothetical protein